MLNLVILIRKGRGEERERDILFIDNNPSTYKYAGIARFLFHSEQKHHASNR